MEIIAEIGQNHNGDMALACKMIAAAKEAGADIAKFQLFRAAETFPPREANPWFDYNCLTELDRDKVHLLAEECARRGIEFMASVFQADLVDWLEAVDVRRYKVASRSVGDAALLSRIAATGTPMIVSLGMWTGSGFPEIPAPREQTEFLYCISQYPTPLEAVHLGRVDFSTYGGFSDHTMGIEASVAAMARGARVIEKHFTLDKALYGPDHACSATPDEFRMLVAFKRAFEVCL
jgi:sialic acid synthase SpsE